MENTTEFECIADRSNGANSTCTFVDDSIIGVYTGLKIRNGHKNSWFCEKIYMKIGGIVQREIGKCAEVGDYKTVTVKVSGFDNVCTLIKMQFSSSHSFIAFCQYSSSCEYSRSHI